MNRISKNLKLKAVVVGNDHYNTLHIVRALGWAGFSVDVIIVSDDPRSYVLKSKYVSHGYIKEEKDVIECLLNDCVGDKEIKIPLIPTYDGVAVLLDTHYDLLNNHFVLPSVGGHQGALVRELDKDVQLERAAKVGLHVPYSLPVNLKNDPDLSKVKFPCIVKPRESYKGSKDYFRICHNSKELDEALLSIRDNITDVLVQEFIPNDEVILVGGVRTVEGENFLIGEVNKFKHSNSHNNLGLCCCGFWSPESELAEKCKAYIDSIDYHGFYGFDFIRKKVEGPTCGEDYFLEVNLRTDGLFYFYTHAGLNYPAIWAASCYGMRFDIKPASKRVYGMNEFMYVKNYVSLSSVTDVLKTNVFSMFDLRDAKPFFFKIRYRL